MRSIAGVRWPMSLLRYERVQSPNLARRARDLRAGASPTDDWVEPGPIDLQQCLPAEGTAIETHEELEALVAEISGLNPHLDLFFRGQRGTFPRGEGLGPMLCPELWRDGKLTFDERVRTLKRCTRRIYRAFREYGRCDRRILQFMEESPITQWALLQHYELCATPLLDVTRSLRVACSFALLPPKDPSKAKAKTKSGGSRYGYVFVLGLPHQHETITTSFEDGIVNANLLGVTPPDAKRPLIQQGFLAGSSDWWRIYAEWPHEYTGRRDVDFACRMIAVLRISKDRGMTTGGERWLLNEDELMPKDDPFFRYLQDMEFEKEQR